jgi:hypothetical protein
MKNVSRRGWTTLAVLLALGGVSLSLWAWADIAAETDPATNDGSAAADTVPDREGEAAPSDPPGDGADGGENVEPAQPLPINLPQPPLRKREPVEREDFTDVLEIEVEKPYRRVRGKENRFDVTVRVKNVSDEAVEGPVFLTVTGATFANLELLRAPAISQEGRPLFEVIEKGKSLSERVTRGRLIRMSFEIGEPEDAATLKAKTSNLKIAARKLAGEQPFPEPGAEGELTEESLAAAEIDFALTREGLALAEPIARSKVPHGRGKGLKGRALPIPSDDPDLARAQEAMAEVSGDIIKMDGVHAVGTSINENDDIVQLVLIARLGVNRKLPKEIGGVPVETHVTWPIKPYELDDPNNRGQAGTAIVTLPPPGECPTFPPCTSGGLQSRFDPEIPIGAQIANVTDPFVGTYGALVQRSNVSFILSNSHVLADANLAVPGERIAQPLPGPLNEFASLAGNVVIDFSPGASNLVDGAIAQIDAGSPRIPTFITPCYGYGAQGQTTTLAQIGDSVSKCGRTTNCTQGQVTSNSMTVNVNFAPQPIAMFVNQVTIVGNGGLPFSAGGDSGSMIVNTANNANLPTSLLFAGGLSGGIDFTFGNQIDDVLTALQINVIGVPPGCPTTVSP